MPTEAGLPGWFPEDFKTDPALLDAFEDGAEWHAAASASGQGGQQHIASLRHLAAHGTPAQKKAAAAVLARMGHSK